MKEKAAKVIVQDFLKGVFDVFDAMLSLHFEHKVEEILEIASHQIEDLLIKCPVAFQGRIASGEGAVLLLFSEADAARIAGIMQGKETEQTTLDNPALATLRELAEAALGGAVNNLKELVGKSLEPLNQMQAAVFDVSESSALMELLGPKPTAALFSFDAGENFSGEGALIFSASLEQWVPKKVLRDGIPEAKKTSALTPDEVSDILRGFAGEEAPALTGAPGAAEQPRNLDMVLDIRLEATVRLGRVEMPIAEILNLGPGSIIEVGHLVDEPVELFINDKLIARGDVVVVDEKFGLRITEIISTRARIESLH